MNDGDPGGFDGTQAKITPSLACNNDCRFCYNRAEKVSRRPMSEGDVMRLVDEAAAAAPTQLNLIGGEVTILPYFVRALERAKGRFRDISVNTNGRRFADADFARACVDSGLSEVDVSLHGSTAAMHDHVSRTPGAFSETTAGLGNLLALQREGLRVKVSVTTIVLDWNAHDLVALGEALRALGVSSWRIKWAYGALGGHADDAPSEYIVRYADALPQVREAIRRHTPALHIIVHDVPLCLLGDLSEFSTLHDRHVVARFEVDRVEPAAPVRGRWGETASRCDGCAERAACCRPSAAYVRRFGEDELTPLGPDELRAISLRGKRFRAELGGASPPGGRGPEAHRSTLDAAHARMDAPAREGRWRAARAAALKVLAQHPGDPSALRMQHVAEAHILDESARECEQQGRSGRAKQLRRLLMYHYADVAVG
jgi:pyruvate-formate lyase-activating enzyme